MKSRRIIPGLIAVAVTGVLVYFLRPGMPFVAWRALNNSDRYELLSLQPRPSQWDFYGQKILGGTVIVDAATRSRLNQAFQRGVREGDRSPAACFEPHHGIRATSKGVTTDFVICFECRQVQVWRGDERIAYFFVADSPRAVFDEVLKAAGVQFAPKEP